MAGKTRVRTILKIAFFLMLISAALLGCEKQSSQLEKAKPYESNQRKTVKYASTATPELKARRAEVNFDVTVDVPYKVGKVRLWLPYPVSNENQSIRDVKINGNFDYQGVYTEGKFGNAILYAEWNNPAEKPSLNFSFKVERKEIWRKNFNEKPGGKIPPEVRLFLQPSKNIPLTQDIKKLAQVITKGKKSTLEKAAAIYDYLVENYRRDESVVGCGTGNFASVVEAKAGKCADIHSVFVGLARATGIPAKEVFGIRIPPDPEGDMTKAYHCIAFFYLPNFGWVPVDASDVLKLMLKENLTLKDEKVKEAREYFFGAQNPNYIEFGTGRDLILNPQQNGQPLNYFMYPYAEVDGKPLDYLSQKELKYKVTYREF